MRKAITHPLQNNQGAEVTPARGADERCPCFLVRSLSRKISPLYDDCLAPCGLKGPQFSLLLHTGTRRGQAPLAISALAHALNTDRTMMTRNLRKQEQEQEQEQEGKGEARFRQALGLWRQAQAQVSQRCGAQQIAAWELLVDGMLVQMPCLKEQA